MLGVATIATATAGFFYYQYFLRQGFQLPTYEFSDKSLKLSNFVLPEVQSDSIPQSADKIESKSTFTDVFSGNGWLNTEKTTVYQDFNMTELSFPPKFEWRKVTEDELKAPISKYNFFKLEQDSSNKRCLSGKCLVQNGNELFFGDKLVSLPLELQSRNLLNISIGATDTFWLLGGVFKLNGSYHGLVYKFDGKEFTKVFNGNDFVSFYPGVFGFGGVRDNWLAIYAAYEGIAWQVRERNGLEFFNNISRFFPRRLMGESVSFTDAKEKFTSFIPEAVKNGNSWYVYSLTSGKPKFIKLLEDGEGKIGSAWDLTNVLGLDKIAKSAVFAIDPIGKSVEIKNGSFLALVNSKESEVGASEIWRFIDFGFDKSKSLEAVSQNLNNLGGEVTSAEIRNVAIFGNLDTKQPEIVFFLSNDGENWHEVSTKQEFFFPTDGGSQLFWKARFIADDDFSASAVLDSLTLVYTVRR